MSPPRPGLGHHSVPEQAVLDWISGLQNKRSNEPGRNMHVSGLLKVILSALVAP